MRFEKVSFTAFYEDMKKHFRRISDKEINEAYDHIIKPERSTRYSACYDLHSPIKAVLPPGQNCYSNRIKGVFQPSRDVRMVP